LCRLLIVNEHTPSHHHECDSSSMPCWTGATLASQHSKLTSLSATPVMDVMPAFTQTAVCDCWTLSVFHGWATVVASLDC